VFNFYKEEADGEKKKGCRKRKYLSAALHQGETFAKRPLLPNFCVRLKF
jgi:hypothetical protein